MSDATSSHVRNLKRDRLLTEKEKERLLDRKDKSKVAVNDARVRKKLSNWLKTLDEVSLIFNGLPQEQTRSVLTNESVFELLCLAARALKIKDYYPADGLVNDPYTWEIDFDRCKPLNYEKCNARLFRAKYGDFIAPSESGWCKYDKQILSILQTGITINLEGLIKGLHIDPNDSEAVEIVQEQLKAFSRHGFVDLTENGWRWAIPRDPKEEKS